MTLGVIVSLFGLGTMLVLLFTLAIYAVPFFVGLTVGMWAFETGAGVIGAVFVPVFVFFVIGRMFAVDLSAPEGQTGIVGVDLAVFAALLIAISAVLSLVTIIAIYRESGILKRLRATPLPAWTSGA